MSEPMTADLFRPIHGPHRKLAEAERAETTDGIVRLTFFPMGMARMDEEDWRQFEITPENVLKMADLANAKLVGGQKIRVNYGHDGSGRKAGEVLKFEADGSGLHGYVKWTPAARAAIRTDPPEWDGFSPEFFAERVMDTAERKPVMHEGREVLRPYEITGGALTNTPAMPDLRVAANKATPADAGDRIGNAPSAETAKNEETDMALPKETLARLGLAEDAGPEDVQKAIDSLADKLAALTPAVSVAVEPPAPVVAAVEPPPDLTAQIQAEAAKLHEKAEHERNVAAAVEKALADGKITAAQKPDAETFAAANLEGFKKFVEAMPVVAPVGKDKLATRTASKTKRAANDYIGDAAVAFNPERLNLHLAAVAYSEENKVSYAQAALAVSRK